MWEPFKKFEHRQKLTEKPISSTTEKYPKAFTVVKLNTIDNKQIQKFNLYLPICGITQKIPNKQKIILHISYAIGQ